MSEQPIPTRIAVTELGSENRPTPPAPPAAPPPTEPTDLLHLHRRFDHLLSILEQTGSIPSDERDRIRAL